MKNKKKIQITNSNVYFGIGAILTIWILSGILTWNIVDSEKIGIFGDMFGAVNALFSGLALFGIIVSIIMQKEELGLQRIELRNTRTEFETNRLTNIVFKQVEYLNSYASKCLFKTNMILANSQTTNFGDIKELMQKFKESERPDDNKTDLPTKISNLLSTNQVEVMVIIDKCYNSFNGLKDVLDKSVIDREIKDQLMQLFASNVDLYLYDFFNYYFKFLNKVINDNKEKKRETPTIVNERLEKVEFLREYQ